MSQLNFEQVVNAVRTLSPEQLAQLREIVNERYEEPPPETNGRRNGRPRSAVPAVRIVPRRDFSADRKWLAEHRAEYAGQWVAVKEGQLLAHSLNAKEVFAAVRDMDALIVLVEPPRDHPFINIG